MTLDSTATATATSIPAATHFDVSSEVYPASRMPESLPQRLREMARTLRGFRTSSGEMWGEPLHQAIARVLEEAAHQVPAHPDARLPLPAQQLLESMVRFGSDHFEAVARNEDSYMDVCHAADALAGFRERAKRLTGTAAGGYGEALAAQAAALAEALALATVESWHPRGRDSDEERQAAFEHWRATFDGYPMPALAREAIEHLGAEWPRTYPLVLDAARNLCPDEDWPA